MSLKFCLIKWSVCRNKAFLKAILKKMSIGGNISGKKVNRKEGNFYFFLRNIFKYSANLVHTNIWFPEREREIRQF